MHPNSVGRPFLTSAIWQPQTSNPHKRARGAAQPHLTRFRPLEVFGRRPSVRVAMPVMGRHPKTFTPPEVAVWAHMSAPPSRPGEFHPEPLTEPDLTLSRHPARAIVRRLPPSIEHRVPPEERAAEYHDNRSIQFARTDRPLGSIRPAGIAARHIAEDHRGLCTRESGHHGRRSQRLSPLGAYSLRRRDP